MVSLQWSEIVRFWILFCIIAPLGAFSKTGCPVAGSISIHFRARGVSGYAPSIFLNSFDRIMRIRVCLAVFLLSKLRKFSEISIFSMFSELIPLFRGVSPEMLGQNSINPPQEFDKSTSRDHENARGIVWRGGALIENRVGIRSPYTGSAFSNIFWFSKIELIWFFFQNFNNK